jgi:Acyl-CoA reductase (LuxC)
VAARHMCVEGSIEQVDGFCALLCQRLAVEREFASARGPKPPTGVREAVEGMRWLEPDFRVWGSFDGSRIVVRSPEPVDFHPTHKTVNVIPVPSILHAAQFATVATQTVGVYPSERKYQLRDRLASAGVQRVVRLGSVLTGSAGNPHDGMFPLHRLVTWVVDDDA